MWPLVQPYFKNALAFVLSDREFKEFPFPLDPDKLPFKIVKNAHLAIGGTSEELRMCSFRLVIGIDSV